MAKFEDTNDFDRLGGEPDEPELVGTGDLVGTTSPEQRASSLVFGDMTMSEIKRVPQSGPPPSPLPWVIAAITVVIAAVLFFAFVLPSQTRIEEARAAEEDARKELANLQEKVATLEKEKVTLEEARAAAAAEAERRANELDATQRGDETQDALDKRKAAKKGKKAKKKRKG